MKTPTGRNQGNANNLVICEGFHITTYVKFL
jgi:hypothetical protein